LRAVTANGTVVTSASRLAHSTQMRFRPLRTFQGSRAHEAHAFVDFGRWALSLGKEVVENRRYRP